MTPPPGSVIDVRVLAGEWRAAGDAVGIARRAAAATLTATLAATPCELSIVLADDAAVRRLNRDYRGRDAATNVLSFAAGDRPVDAGAAQPALLGDVVVAAGTVAREAREQAKSVGDHLAHLIVHGTLHLLGYDHEDESAASEMETLERHIVAQLGIDDPYAVLDRSIDAA